MAIWRWLFGSSAALWFTPSRVGHGADAYRAMPPGILTSDFAGASIDRQNTMEDSMLPPISGKSAMSLGSETDPSEFCNTANVDRKGITTRSSMPLSLSSSPVKFPTIDRASSTSIASLPGSRAARQRTLTREFRTSYCRSPSCPSILDMNRNNVDIDLFDKRQSHTDADSSDVGSTEPDDSPSKLPSIFSSRNYADRYDRGESPRRDKKKEKLSSLSLRKGEPTVHTFQRHKHYETKTQNKEQDQRQSQATALLLPIRTNAQLSNKNKKKRRARKMSDSESDPLEYTTPRNFPDSARDFTDRLKTLNKNGDPDEALNAIARENDLYDDDLDRTPRAVEISSSRKVKQWINNNQKEGHVKA